MQHKYHRIHPSSSTQILGFVTKIAIIAFRVRSNRRLIPYEIKTAQDKAFLFVTFKTSKFEAVIAWNVVPSVFIPCAKSVYTVLIRIIVWLVWRPESKATCAFVCPHEWSFYASIIEPNPGFLSIMPMLNVNVFFLIMDGRKMWTHFNAFFF